MTKTGIVLQIEKNKAILMTSSGEFVKAKFSGKAPTIGDTYTGKIYKENNLMKFAVAAACLMFMFLSGGGAYAYYSPVATVKVSINPSLELKLNRFNRIIKYTPLNKDGETLLSHIDLKNYKVDDGLNKIVEEAKKENFINDNYINSGKVISVNIISSNNDKTLDLPKFEKYITDNKLNLKLNKNGNETKLEHKNPTEVPRKDTPSANNNNNNNAPEKDIDSSSGNASKTNDNNNYNNKNEQEHGYDKNQNGGGGHNGNEKKNNSDDANTDNPQYNNSNEKIDHPSGNPGHTPGHGKSKKK